MKNEKTFNQDASLASDAMLKGIVRREFDAEFSFLEGRPSLRPDILRRIEGERVVKRKISVALVFALIAMLAAMTALAAGINFSNKVDVKRAALDALQEKYGITEEMLTVLHVEVGEQDENGAQTVTLTPVEWQYAERVGQYAATVQGGKVTASWSHDGEEIGEGIESPVYGAEQLGLLCRNYTEVMSYLIKVEGSARPEPMPTPVLADDDGEPQDYETWLAAKIAAWEQSRSEAEAAAKLTLEECKAIAIQAIRREYGLTDEQMAKLQAFEGGYENYDLDFSLEDGQPVASMLFRLWQAGEAGDYAGADDFTEKDGHYWVDVNMVTGVIEDILYDSGLAGNG